MIGLGWLKAVGHQDCRLVEVDRGVIAIEGAVVVEHLYAVAGRSEPERLIGDIDDRPVPDRPTRHRVHSEDL